jgi:integrase/recombinase XerD
MLTIFRRHSRKCPHRHKKRQHKTCNCPIHVQGSLERHPLRQALATRSWSRAQEIVRQWEADGRMAEPIPHVADCCHLFLEDCRARGLSEETVKKYRRVTAGLESFCKLRNIHFPNQLSLDHLTRFRSQWKNRNYAALKKLESLRTLFKFFLAREWITKNPSSDLARPVIRTAPTMPFSREEMQSIVSACDEYDPGKRSHYGPEARIRLKAFVLLLRYSGLRIGDVCTLRVDRVTNGKLLLFTAKTGTPVYIVLPPYLVALLSMFKPTSKDFFFWNGKSKRHTPVSVWEASLQKLFRLAKVHHGHPHRFRDTFAIELLLTGMPIERVSVLLGHRSVKVTEKHYAPWVRARQVQAEADVRKSWDSDPILCTNIVPDTENTGHTSITRPNRIQ